MDPTEYQAAPDFTGPCVLYKIHGTAGSHATYVDTVEQKVRGLTNAKRAHLKSVYGKFHTLFLGYSGRIWCSEKTISHFESPAATGPRLHGFLEPKVRYIRSYWKHFGR